MRKAWLALATVLVAVAPAAQGGAQEKAAERPRNILLIGWDGCQREHMKQCLNEGELPNLKALGAEGRLVDIDIRGTTDPKVLRDGDRADITPTLYDRFGLDPARFDPPLQGRSLLRPLPSKAEPVRAEAPKADTAKTGR